MRMLHLNILSILKHNFFICKTFIIGFVKATDFFNNLEKYNLGKFFFKCSKHSKHFNLLEIIIMLLLLLFGYANVRGNIPFYHFKKVTSECSLNV